MKNFDKKLKKYQELNKGLRVAKTNPVSKLLTKQNLALLTLPVLSFGTAEAQCLGSVNGGATQTLNTPIGAGNGIAFDADGIAGNDFSVFAIGSALKIRELGGGTIYASAGTVSASALTFAPNANISGGAVFANPYLAYNHGNNGAITGGATKTIGFKIGANTGFITLTVNHTNSGVNTGRYQVAILERGTSVAGATAKAGDCGTLPVELTNFYSKAEGESIHLHWATASEENNSGFELQRSTDGKRFHNVSFIEGAGNTLNSQTYHYEDKELKKGQVYYYRLQQVDFDGTVTYTHIITGQIVVDNNTVGLFYPNPADNNKRTQIEYNSTYNTDELVVTVYNLTGQKLHEETRTIEEGKNVLDFDFSKLSAGDYFIKFNSNTGSHYKRLILN